MQIRWILSCSTVLGLVKLTKIFQSKRFKKTVVFLYFIFCFIPDGGLLVQTYNQILIQKATHKQFLVIK